MKTKYRNKREIVFKKGEETHLDEIEHSQSTFMGCFDHKDDDELSDELICNANCKITLEWD